MSQESCEKCLIACLWLHVDTLYTTNINKGIFSHFMLFFKLEFCSLDDIIPFNKHMDPFQVFLIVVCYYFRIFFYRVWWVFVRFNFQEVA
jgi:hypothetical protein